MWRLEKSKVYSKNLTTSLSRKSEQTFQILTYTPRFDLHICFMTIIFLLDSIFLFLLSFTGETPFRQRTTHPNGCRKLDGAKSLSSTEILSIKLEILLVRNR